MIGSRLYEKIMWVWRKNHSSLNKLPAWREAAQSYAAAKRRGCTQDIHRAKEAMKRAVLDDLRRV